MTKLVRSRTGDAVGLRIQIEDACMAAGGLNQPGKQTNGRGFSRAVAAEKSINRAPGHMHLQPIDGMRMRRTAYAENAFR